MTINVWAGDGARRTLTTEHAASSYGIPVLVVGETAYGPGDVLPTGETARAFVGRFLIGSPPQIGRWAARTPEALDAARRFLGMD